MISWNIWEGQIKGLWRFVLFPRDCCKEFVLGEEFKDELKESKINYDDSGIEYFHKMLPKI